MIRLLLLGLLLHLPGKHNQSDHGHGSRSHGTSIGDALKKFASRSSINPGVRHTTVGSSTRDLTKMLKAGLARAEKRRR